MLRQFFYHALGGAVLILNKLRYSILGYRRPRVFSQDKIIKVIEYAQNSVDLWLGELKKLEFSAAGKDILELGPGPDLCAGSLLIAHGAKSYTAFDKFPLMNFEDKLYSHLANFLKSKYSEKNIKEEIITALASKPGRLNYIVDPEFNLQKLPLHYDLIVSLAAFEHFENIEKTIEQVSNKARPGAVFLADIDLQTHTRILREKDPLNIYRYSNNFYKFCRFSGIPNRRRIAEYQRIMEKNGWKNVKIIPTAIADANYCAKTVPRLKEFKNFQDEMHILEFILTAIKN